MSSSNATRAGTASALDIALNALELGFSPLPPVEDGTKRPLADVPDGRDENGKQQWVWAPYMLMPATRQKVRQWFKGDRQSIGLVTGYNELECFEFDCPETYERFLAAASAIGLCDLVTRIRAGYEEKTPGQGYHWLYYCGEVRGNQKLAERTDPVNAQKRIPLIETRGEGGFIIIAPSKGRVHPSGGAYELLSGGLGSVVTLTSGERESLWDLARTFDELPLVEKVQAPNPQSMARNGTDPDVRPGDDYEAHATWEDLLQPLGWVRVFTRGDTTYWRRPGKDLGVSATTGHCKGLYVFSTSTSFEARTSYSKFGAYARIHHGGDHHAAAKALSEAGYGSRPRQYANGNGQLHSDGTNERRAPGFPEDLIPIMTDLLPVPALDPEMIPVPLRAWLVDIAERGCFPLEYGAAAAIVALSGLIGRRMAIRPKRHDDWLIVPNLWGAVVGPPGIQKTPAVDEALRPLARLAAESLTEYEQAKEDFETAKVMMAAKKKVAEKKLQDRASKGANDTELARLAAATRTAMDMPEPIHRRYLVNDATLEKLGELLRDNPFGLTCFRDELIGFLRTMDRQGHEADRGFYLESWNGFNSYIWDRILRGTLIIPNVCLAIFGGIVPGPLSHYVRGAAAGEEADGFVPRFQVLVYPDCPKNFVHVDRYPNREAKN